MQTISTKPTTFIAEHDGEAERIFKKEICSMLSEYKKDVRAYLARVSYDSVIHPNDINVVLCFRIIDVIVKKDYALLEAATTVLQKHFGSTDKINILFLTQEQEIALRNVCCPFYVSEGFQFTIPDFYLAYGDGYKFETPFMCFKRKKLYGQNPQVYMLCDINPPMIGQRYGLGRKDIHQIVLFARHVGASLFDVKTWPVYVHLFRSLCDNLDSVDYVDKSNIQSMIWGEIYKDLSQTNA
jgi:hypothetical protein